MSEAWVNLTGSSALGLTIWGKFCFQALSGCLQSSGACSCKTEVPSSLVVFSSRRSLLFLITVPLHLQKATVPGVFLMLQISVTSFPWHLFCLWLNKVLYFWGFMWLDWTHLNNLPILRLITLLTSAKSLCPVTKYSWEPGIRVWIYLERNFT